MHRPVYEVSVVKPLYTTLGIAESASDIDVRAAYRRLAKKYHPDRNPGNQAAEEKFKRVSLAFDILGDKQKRRQYDRGEIDEMGQMRYAGPASGARAAPRDRAGAYAYGRNKQQAPGEAYDIGSIFADLFGGAGAGAVHKGPGPGSDIRYRLEIDLLEAAKGVKKRVALPDRRHLDVTVPAGMRDGGSLRLKGQGGTGSFGGEPGDIYVEIHVRAHRFFTLDGLDVYLDLPLSLKEALLGAQIPVPSLDGTLKLKIPSGTSSGVKLRVRGRGLRDTKTDQIGDQIVVTRIILPQSLTADLEALTANLDDSHVRDERRRLYRSD